MNNSRPMTTQEREAYHIGYEHGRQEGLKKHHYSFSWWHQTVMILKRVFFRAVKKLLS